MGRRNFVDGMCSRTLTLGVVQYSAFALRLGKDYREPLRHVILQRRLLGT